jgi:hypothetical protein
MMSPDEILEQAKLLEDDDARRQLANNLRLEARELEFDEREERLRLADQIESLCTTPDAPAIQQTPLAARPRTVEERYSRYGAEIMRDIRELYEELIQPLVISMEKSEKKKERLLNILAAVYAEFSGEAYPGKRDYRAAKIIAELNEWAETPLDREALASHFELLLDDLTPIKRGVGAARIHARDRSIGNRGHDDGAVPTDDGGARERITRSRGSALDKKLTFGKNQEIDHTKGGRAAAQGAEAGRAAATAAADRALGSQAARDCGLGSRPEAQAPAQAEARSVRRRVARQITRRARAHPLEGPAAQRRRLEGD